MGSVMKRTPESFKKEIDELTNGEITVLEDYKGVHEKILFRHNCSKCNNYEWETIPKVILGGHGCPKCQKLNRTKTHEQYVEEIFDKYGNEYEILGTYTNANAKILVKHNKCGNTWEVRSQNLLRSNCCPKCAIELARQRGLGTNNFKRIRKTQEEFEQDIFDKYGEEYKVLGNYVNSKTKILMKHCSCGNEYLVRPADILSGYRCPKCFGTPKKTTEQFKKEVFDLVGDEYKVLGEYQASKTKIEMQHSKCKTIFKVPPSEFLYQESRCPYCRESKGERRIQDYFNKNDITYVRQYKDSNCRNKRALPFDFAVYDQNNNLKFLIEYQGKQHFVNEGHFYKSNEEFIDRILLDCSKQAFCEFEYIDLLQINYKDFDNLEKILKEYLDKYSLLNGGDAI